VIKQKKTAGILQRIIKSLRTDKEIKYIPHWIFKEG